MEKVKKLESKFLVVDHTNTFEDAYNLQTRQMFEKTKAKMEPTYESELPLL